MADGNNPLPALPVLAYQPPNAAEASRLRWPLWLTVPAAISPFVPIVRTITPLNLLIEALPRVKAHPFLWDTGGRVLLASLFFLWPVFLICRFLARRRVESDRTTTLAWAIITLSGLAWLAVVALIVLMLQRASFMREAIYLVGSGTIFLVFGAIAVIRTWLRPTTPDVRALTAMGSALLPHAVIAIIAASAERPAIGVALILPATIGLVVEISLYSFSKRYRMI